MTEFPTKPQLADIYAQQGNEAIAWYAWRNALRVVPVLGRIPLRTMWPKFTVQNTYFTLRTCFLLSQGSQLISREIADKAKGAASNAANFEGFATHDIGMRLPMPRIPRCITHRIRQQWQVRLRQMLPVIPMPLWLFPARMINTMRLKPRKWIINI